MGATGQGKIRLFLVLMGLANWRSDPVTPGVPLGLTTFYSGLPQMHGYL